MAEKKINILHVIKSLGHGGAEVLLKETYNKHNKKKFNFHYAYFLFDQNSIAKELENAGARVKCVEANSNYTMFAKIGKLAKYIRENDIDIVHAHLPLTGILARFLCGYLSVPLVYTEHNIISKYHPAVKWGNILTYPLQKTGIAVSNDVAKSISKYKNDLSSVYTILNGVNTDKFNPNRMSNYNIDEKLNISSDDIVIGTVAKFSKQKRLDLFLELAKSLYDNNEGGVRFLLVGDGKVYNDIYKKAEKENILDIVHFAGIQSDIRPWLDVMDIFLVTSEFEGLPVAILEAMSMKLPLVATRVGGIPEVIDSGSNGILFDFPRIDIAEKNIIELINNHQKRFELGEKARHTVVDNFSIKRMCNELEDLYFRIHNN